MPRVRIRFAKQADLRLIGHHDLVTALERLFRRMGLGLTMSQGFHPRPKMSFPLALGLGIAATDELFDLDLVESHDPSALLAGLRQNAPPGLEFLSVEPLGPNVGKAKVESVEYRFPLPSDRRLAAQMRIDELMSQPKYPIRREGRDQPIDLRATLVELSIDDAAIVMRMRVVHEAAARPQEVVEALGLADMFAEGHFLTRTEVRLANQLVEAIT